MACADAFLKSGPAAALGRLVQNAVQHGGAGDGAAPPQNILDALSQLEGPQLEEFARMMQQQGVISPSAGSDGLGAESDNNDGDQELEQEPGLFD